MVSDRGRPTARKARPVGSTPFQLPPSHSDDHESTKPEPTDADARAFRPTTTPLDFEAWPWKTSASSASAKSAGYVSADQKGWRSKAEEDRTLSHPHNRNLAGGESVPRRGWKQNPLHSWSADVTHGVWSCCHAVSLGAPGCQSGGHTSEWCQCSACGQWIPMERWASSKCLCHPGEPVHSRYGGMRWSCCGGVGYEGSRADYKGAKAWKEWKNKPLCTQTLREWQVWHVKKMRQPVRQGGAIGCCDGEHVARPPPHREWPKCSACGVPAQHGQWCCKGCGRDERICYQCWELHPSERFEQVDQAQAEEGRLLLQQKVAIPASRRGAAGAVEQGAELDGTSFAKAFPQLQARHQGWAGHASMPLPCSPCCPCSPRRRCKADTSNKESSS